MLDILPSVGFMTHGLVEYPLRVFWTLCRFNEYEVLDLTVVHSSSTEISSDVIGSNQRFSRFWLGTLPKATVPLMNICATLRKMNERPFVVSLDFPMTPCALPIRTASKN